MLAPVPGGKTREPATPEQAPVGLTDIETVGEFGRTCTQSYTRVPLNYCDRRTMLQSSVVSLTNPQSRRHILFYGALRASPAAL